MKALVIGDVHFQKDAHVQGEELIEKILEKVKGRRVDFVVLLGDILDTHETAKNGPFKQAERLIKGISKEYPLYVLMGNHDLINRDQFITDNHFFNPYKRWDNVTIVDKPIHVCQCVDGNTLQFVMCPYVPPGRFIEALNMLSEVDWIESTCIFAHQEFKNVFYNGRESEKGDEWNKDFPLVVSGHIHKYQRIDNIFYTGSARQVAFNEPPEKWIWRMEFTKDKKRFVKIDLKLKAKKEISIDYKDIKSFDFDLLNRYYVKLNITGIPEQFKLLRKHPIYLKLIESGVRLSFITKRDDNSLVDNLAIALKNEITFETILEEIVKTKEPHIQNALNELKV